ncbi:MAG: hypothetical protein K6G33_10685, partial [Ruminococcus sp.]|uniref:hypothetical protein n=1 Tax=Ruminococcus sp. TaxID=41978 RepID=UPI0025CFA407
ISIAIAAPCSSCTQALSLIIQDFYFSGSFFYYHFEANWLSFILAYIFMNCFKRFIAKNAKDHDRERKYLKYIL